MEATAAPSVVRDPSIASQLSAIVGAPLVAFFIGATIARYAPLSAEASLAFGFHLVIPVWVALACWLPLMSSGRRAWIFCLGLSVPAALAVLLPPGRG